MSRYFTTFVALSTLVGSFTNGEPHEGLAIPLHKRAPVENEIGEVDWARAARRMARTHRKFGHGDDAISRGMPEVPGVGLGRRAWESTDSDSLEWNSGDGESLLGYSKRMLGSLEEVLQDEGEEVKAFAGFRGGKRAETTVVANPKMRSRTASSTPASVAATTGSPVAIVTRSRVATSSARPVSSSAAPVVSSQPPSSSSSPAPSSSSSTRPASSAAASPSPVIVAANPASSTSTLSDEGALWAGYITIGSPAKTYYVCFDTGSADLWVPSINSSSVHQRYDSTTSSTSSFVSGKTLNLVYGDGSRVSGPVWMDTVALAGITASGQTFGAASTISAQFNTDPTGGLLGMGYQAISQLRSMPFFQTLVAQNKVVSPMFSFRLNAPGSELFLGGMNPKSFVAGTTEWYPVSSQSYWVIPGVANVNGKSSGLSFSAIIDTGTTVIVIPTTEAAKFWATVPNSGVYGSGYYTYPCATPPVISFSFGGSTKQWVVRPVDLNLGTVSQGSPRCVGAIVGQDVGVNAWILGDRFLEGQYTTFDLGTNRVGFSTLS